MRQLRCARNDVASLPDESGRVRENGEILFGEIEVTLLHCEQASKSDPFTAR